MAIFKSDLITEIVKGISKKVMGHSQGSGQQVDFQSRNGKLIMRKKSMPTLKQTEKQQAWREKFCAADTLYRKLTQEQKNRFYDYTQYYNRKHNENYSPHSLWMRLFLKGELDEFLEKFLGWKWGEIQKEEFDTHICWQIYVIPHDYQGLNESILTDTGAVRR